METYPHELFTGCETTEERSARIGRLETLDELGYFGEETNIKLARKERTGSFIAQVRKKFSGVYQNTNGCSAGDIECAAMVRGVFDQVFDVEASQNSKYLEDR